ncbi:MAG: hypothetical protein ACTS4Z_00895 [Candidatus Hodgkinia cicadicola]
MCLPLVDLRGGAMNTSFDKQIWAIFVPPLEVRQAFFDNLWI